LDRYGEDEGNGRSAREGEGVEAAELARHPRAVEAAP
jgi:hypothetical protein